MSPSSPRRTRSLSEEPSLEQPPKKSSVKKKAVIGGLGIAVIVATFVFILPRIADYRSVWNVVNDLSAWDHRAARARDDPQPRDLRAAVDGGAAGPRLPRRRSVLTLASTASTYVAPGGAAVGMAASFAMLRGVGLPGQPVTIAVAVTGIWNQFAMLGFPIVALVAAHASGTRRTASSRPSRSSGSIVFVVAVAGFVAGLSTPQLAKRVGDARGEARTWASSGSIRRRPVTWPASRSCASGTKTVQLLARRWHVLTARDARGPAHGVPRAARLAPGLRRVVGEVTFVEAFASWSVVRLLGSLPITPGGIGIVEVGLTGALVGFGGHNADVVAAVLVYRFLTIVRDAAPRLLAGATWKKAQPARCRGDGLINSFAACRARIPSPRRRRRGRWPQTG